MVGTAGLVVGVALWQTVAGGVSSAGRSTVRDLPARRVVQMRLLAFTSLTQPQHEILVDQLQRIWIREGIEIRWTCDNDTECISLVLIDQRPSPAADMGGSCALGEIPFVEGRPLRTLYVAMNRIRELVRDSIHGSAPPAVQELLVARVAGRAAAHELAHYLLATRGHAIGGLLRRVFRPETLLGASLEPFMLDERQRKALSLLQSRRLPRGSRFRRSIDMAKYLGYTARDETGQDRRVPRPGERADSARGERRDGGHPQPRS